MNLDHLPLFWGQALMKGGVFVNYADEVSAFYDWLEVNELPQSAVLLWHALMHLYHKSGQQQTFTVARSVIEAKTGMKKDAYYNARNQLKIAGLIDFKTRGNKATIFKMNSLLSEKQTLNQTTKPVKSEKQTITQTINQTINQTATPTSNQTFNIDRQKERQTDDNADATWQDIENIWSEVFRFRMKPNHSEMLGAFIDQDGMTHSLIVEAIERVRNAETPNMRYLWKILGDWAKLDIRTIRDLVEHEKNRMGQLSTNTKVKPFHRKQDNLAQLDEVFRKMGLRKGG